MGENFLFSDADIVALADRLLDASPVITPASSRPAVTSPEPADRSRASGTLLQCEPDYVRAGKGHSYCHRRSILSQKIIGETG
jgi:hypothetical protein